MAKKKDKPLTELQQKFFEAWGKEGFAIEKRFKAALEAGYPPQNLPAHAHNAITAIGNNAKMCKAMEDEGITFEFLAKRLKINLEAQQPLVKKDGTVIWYDDGFVQNKALDLNMKILDALAPKKLDVDWKQYSRVDINISEDSRKRAKKASEELEVIDVIPEEFSPD